LPGEGFKRAWPPLIKMDARVRPRLGLLISNSARKLGVEKITDFEPVDSRIRANCFD
jgi:hypothetical protein